MERHSLARMTGLKSRTHCSHQSCTHWAPNPPSLFCWLPFPSQPSLHNTLQFGKCFHSPSFAYLISSCLPEANQTLRWLSIKMLFLAKKQLSCPDDEAAAPRAPAGTCSAPILHTVVSILTEVTQQRKKGVDPAVIWNSGFHSQIPAAPAVTWRKVKRQSRIWIQSVSPEKVLAFVY